jgi:O-antigen/teichoic acid export membrane protein
VQISGVTETSLGQSDGSPPSATRLQEMRRRLAGGYSRAMQMLSGRLAIAIGWTAFAMIVTQVLRLVGSLIMTRLLAPEMFGIMSIVLSVQVTLFLLLDIGLRPAIIQSARGNDPELLNTAWTVQIIRSFIVAILLVLIAMMLPHAVEIGLFSADSAWAAPDLPLVLAVVSLSAVIVGFESTNAITAERNLALKRFTTVKLIGQTAGFFAMVLLGILLQSIWALVASGMISALLVAVLSHTMLPGIRNRLSWNREARSEIARYGSWVMLSSAASVLSMQADRLVLGGLVDSTTLGIYSIALNFAVLFEALASNMIWSVLMPALSEARRNAGESFRRKYFRLRLPLDLGVILIAGGLFASGPAIIQILYDDRYLAAGPMLAILSFMLIFARYTITMAAYMALGKPHLTAVINIVKCLGLFGLLFVLYRYFGVDGAIAAVAIHMLPAVIVMFFFNRKNELNDFRYEIAVLAMWPVGYGLGLIFNAIVAGV